MNKVIYICIRCSVALSIVSLFFFSVPGMASVGVTCGILPCPVLGDPIGQVKINGNAPVFILPPGGSYPATDQVNNGFGSISYNPLPTVISKAQLNPASNPLVTDSSIVTTLIYSATVVSDIQNSNNTPVPIIFSGSYTLEANATALPTGGGSPLPLGQASSSVGITITNSNQNDLFKSWSLPPATLNVSGCPQTFGLLGCNETRSFSEAGNVTTGSVFTIILKASASATLPGVLGTSLSLGISQAFASIDPSITIDPLFENAAHYSIVVSPGVGNISEVPLPSAAVIFILGLMTLIYGRKNRFF